MGAHSEGTLKWAVVKANAYGHGAVAAMAIQDDVDGFCVSNIDEYRTRQANSAKKILILGVSELEAVSLARIHITLTAAEWSDSSSLARRQI